MDFDISKVCFPKNATHVELQLGVLGVDFDLKIYKMFIGRTVVFEKNVVVTDFSLFPEVLPDVGLQRFAFVGVTFYQEINGVKYVLKEDGNVGLMFIG